MQRLRQILTLILLAALPFHAFFVTVGTRLLIGAGQAPLPLLAFWKEGLLLVILGIAFVEIVNSVTRGAAKRINELTSQRFDVVDLCILALIILALLIRPSPQAGGWVSFAYGFKYDLFPLVAFLVLRRVPWSEKWRLGIGDWLLGVGLIIAMYGIVTKYLPDSFFVSLGYSDLHSLYRPDAPIAAFQQIGGTDIRRIQSVMSGPNQLGLWLLLPWTIALQGWLTKIQDTRYKKQKDSQSLVSSPQFLFLIWLLIDTALFLTYSRAAWIAAAVIALILVLRQWKGAWKWLIPGALAAVFIALLWKPDVIIRAASSKAHWERPLQAISVLVKHPFGMGLGSAGPASSRFSDSCVFLEPGSNADWAAPHGDLCVFVGDVQVQPAGRTCVCPLIPENWYLQVGIELGVVGLLIYLAFTILVLRKLKGASEKLPVAFENSQLRIKGPSVATFHWQLAIFLWLLGLSLAGLVLHSFEDAAVAYSVWILVAVALTVVPSQSRH